MIGEPTHRSAPALWHTVLITFRPASTVDQREHVYRRLQALDEACGGADAGILYWQVGHNLDRRKNVHLVEIARFRDQAAFQAFREHPAHQGVVKLMREIADWVVGDLPDDAAFWAAQAVAAPASAAAPEDSLRMAAIFRADLAMPPGKLAVQAGHAFLTTWRNFAHRDPEAASHYATASQTKIVLMAPDLAALERIRDKAEQRGVAYSLIVDAGRTVFTEPTVTVLGLGPMSKTDTNALTRGLDML